MKRLYIKLSFIVIVFLSSYSFSEQRSEEVQKEPIKLPSLFKEVPSSTVTFNNSVFYNQALEKRSLENFDNRFIILHFWATWCMDCQNELSALNKLQKDFRKKALLVLPISEDFKDVSAIDEYYTKHKIDFLDIYIDKRNSIYKNLSINHLPASYLVDFNGEVIASSFPGVPIDWDDEEIRKFLEDKIINHQLLPPEYKTTRETFAPLTKSQEQKKPVLQQKKSEILIN